MRRRSISRRSIAGRTRPLTPTRRSPRSPAPALVGDLRAAVMIEDDDRAFALGLAALAVAGDDGALERARSRT
ncbi:MAG TPA: hypothetical protein VK427_11540, partial [Kofleriaceae bacterium]|nr:hypothetical protein [Kofleriaceae bacterium]